MQASIKLDDLDKKSRAEVQTYLQEQQQNAQVQAILMKITEMCWDKCVSKPGKDLSEGEKTCVANCSERFLDTSMFIAARIQGKMKPKK